MCRRRVFELTLGVVVILLFLSAFAVAADEPNVGILRVWNVQHPRQVAPSGSANFVIDVEYAIRLNATIKASMFQGSLKNLGTELWHSDPVTVSGGGDELWNATLAAPAVEGDWAVTVIASYLEAGKWIYYNDSDRGPGSSQVIIKVARLANLEINLGVPNVPVTIDNSTEKTIANGSVFLQRPVGSTHVLSVPLVVTLENSTRLIFQRWQDGDNSTQRSLLLDGDVRIIGVYRHQYLLRVNSVASAYSQSAWYDPGSNVTLSVDASPSAGWPLSLLGLRYVFRGWSGAVHSSSTSVSLAINQPTTVNADFDLDYGTLVIPAILIVGIVGGVLLAFASRSARAKSSAVEEVEEEVTSEETAAKVCEGCGEPVEEGWTHCTHCGKALGSSEPVQE